MSAHPQDRPQDHPQAAPQHAAVAAGQDATGPEHDQWHPVLALEHADGDGPYPVRLLERDLVLWRNADGWHAWDDRCPHRGAAFTLGRVQDGLLRCGYHGWRFESSGRCTRYPAHPGLVPAPRACAVTHAVREAYGLLWVRLARAGDGAAPPPALPPFPESGAAGCRQVIAGPYDVATSAPRLVENFLDMAHFGYVHDGYLGDPEHTEVPPYEVEASGNPRAPDALRTIGCRAWQPRSHASAEGGAMVEYEYRVVAPYTAVLTKVPDLGDDHRAAIALFICPREPEASRVWFVMSLVSEDDDASLRAFQDTIFLQDQPIVESQRPRRLPLATGVEVPQPADRMASAYRRYLAAHGVRFGTLP
ncbi:aromatic ring-hydroxylating oxygenase subunit alpha [Cupriavidus sp. USMAHM13]|uniref:aromatic ring-hydroxylating oxygenase subunit alpha n=1 Tax=Cupriavidus sp. USMAHM13 TaxID=1389192 RepID=UPI0009F25D89|nr:aromatic ring-hydroxylating dioxygenase subunit alpha [Cupriavidus sp. USMAHM13]